jgi:adenylate cyclase
MHSFQKLLTLESAEKILAFVDIASYGVMVEHDEMGAIDRAREFLATIANTLLPKFDGDLLQRMGDGLLLSFSNAQQSALCALSIHAHSGEESKSHPDGQELSCRIGIHRATVLTDTTAVYGHGVNVAARIAAQALPGETIISAEVKDQLLIGAEAELEDLGDVYVKNVEAPLRLYKVFSPGRIEARGDKPLDQVAARPSIAILPFKHRMGDPTQDALGELICDGLVHEMCRASNFRIISRLSSNVLTSSMQSSEAAKTHLNAHYAVSGAYIQIGQSVMLSVELSITETGQILWTDRLPCKTEDFLQPKADVFTEIATSVIMAIGDEVLLRASYSALPSLASCDLLFGAIALTARTSLADFDKPKRLLEHLIERHNRNALPRVWLAHWYVMKRVQGQLTDLTEAHQGVLHAQRALDMEPANSHALATLGFAQTHIDKDLISARKSYMHALDVDRSSPWAWLYLGALESFEGNGKAAVDACLEAIACSPIDPTRHLFYAIAASAAFTNQEYNRAIEWGNKSRRYDRYHASTIRTLTMSLALSGRVDEARQMKDELIKIEPTLSIKSYLARAPSANFDIGKRCAEGLRLAGIPET